MSDINLNDAPARYFRPQRLKEYLLAQVKSAVLREELRELAADADNVEALLASGGAAGNLGKALESAHPMYMGGQYLPERESGEVEIACIRIESTTHDVTSVFARLDGDTIRNRVVDEYDGDTLSGETETESKEPLTLKELADFLLGAWSLVEVLEMNFEDDLEQSLDFFYAESEFYPGLDGECRSRVIAHFEGMKPARR